MSKYSLIVKYLKSFEGTLNDDEVLGLKFPNYGDTYILQSTATGWDEFIAFDLLTKAGKNVSVIQNYSQLNFAIVSCPNPLSTEKPSKRMGFKVTPE